MSRAPDLERMDRVLREEGVEALLERTDELLGDRATDGGRRSVRAALVLAAAALGDDPAQLPAQLLARLTATGDPTVGQLLEQAHQWDRGPWLQPLTASLAAPGGPLVAGLRGHDDDITAVALTVDGRHAVSGSVPRTVKLWDLERGVERRTLRGSGRGGPGEGYGEGVLALAVADVARRVVAADGDGRIHVWSGTDGSLLQELGGEAGDDEDWLTAVSADGRWAASAFLSSIVPVMTTGQQGLIRIFALETDEVEHTRQDPGGRVGALALTPDGARVVTAGGGLRRWDRARGTVDAYTGPLGCGGLAVNADATVAATGHDDGTITVWDLTSGGSTTTLTGHTGRVNAVALTPEGTLAVSGSDDATVRMWDLPRRTEVRRFSGHVGPVRAVAVTPDGRLAVSGGADRVLRLWALAPTADRRDQPRRLPVEAVAVSGDGRRVVATSADGTREVWDLDEDGAGPEVAGEVAEVPEVAASLRDRVEALEQQEAGDASVHEILALAVTPGGERAVCASRAWTVLSGHHRWAVDTITVRVWDLTPSPVGRVLTQRNNRVVGFQRGEAVRDVAVSADGHYAAAVGDDRTLTVWDLESGDPVGAFTADGRLQVCAISAGAHTVVAGGTTGDVHLLRLTRG